jgi:hypothetical protein
MRTILTDIDLQEIVLYDIVTGASIKHYHGQQQSVHMIRSCFGGSSNGFVISGSEGKVSLVPASEKLADRISLVTLIRRLLDLRLA